MKAKTRAAATETTAAGIMFAVKKTAVAETKAVAETRAVTEMIVVAKIAAAAETAVVADTTTVDETIVAVAMPIVMTMAAAVMVTMVETTPAAGMIAAATPHVHHPRTGVDLNLVAVRSKGASPLEGSHPVTIQATKMTKVEANTAP